MRIVLAVLAALSLLSCAGAPPTEWRSSEPVVPSTTPPGRRLRAAPGGRRGQLAALRGCTAVRREMLSLRAKQVTSPSVAARIGRVDSDLLDAVRRPLNVLQQRTRCSKCGHRGDVTIQGPSWDGPHIRFSRFPVERR